MRSYRDWHRSVYHGVHWFRDEGSISDFVWWAFGICAPRTEFVKWRHSDDIYPVSDFYLLKCFTNFDYIVLGLYLLQSVWQIFMLFFISPLKFLESFLLNSIFPETVHMNYIEYTPWNIDLIKSHMIFQIVVLWVVISCSLVGEYQCFGGARCLYLQVKFLGRGIGWVILTLRLEGGQSVPRGDKYWCESVGKVNMKWLISEPRYFSSLYDGDTFGKSGPS
jgi:hypothetical protein